MEPEVLRNSGDEDCVEAEIVSGPGAFSRTGSSGTGQERRGERARRRTPPLYELAHRVRSLLAFLGVLAGFALIFLGFVLTSTIIGAVIGIPLLILGFMCLWLIFRLLSAGQRKRPAVFRRF